ncbi:SIR2 family protein [Thermodesulfobacteriota bacterium B35]
MHLLNRLVNLARVFLEGRGLPFLGAGISNSARAHCAPEITPTVKWMIRQLLSDQVLNRLVGTDDACQRQQELFKALGKDGDRTDHSTDRDTLREEILKAVDDRLGICCETLNFLDLLSHRDVVRAMRIWNFAGLDPTPAHYYIAFLAQEGLVNEVITTNYDCCLERAAFHVNGLEGDGGPPADGKTQPAVSIADLESYRGHGSRRLQLNHDQGGTIVLRVFKINGCAGLVNRNGRDNSKVLDSILLTERQLQHMDDRTWARDLLRDRARARALVFSGFGSDEPQVRFTVLRLLEEFTPGRSYARDPANAIWLHLYDRKLSFSQQQIMHSYWNGNEKRIREFIFSGRDLSGLAEYLQESSRNTTDGLDADTFWKVIFMIVFLALVEKFIRPSAPGWEFFAALDRPGKPVPRRKEFMDWLDPRGIGRLALSGGELPCGGERKSKNSPGPLETVNNLFTFQETGSWQGVAFCRWLRCLTGRDRAGRDPCLPEVSYLPLQRNLPLVLPLLWFCFRFGQEAFEVCAAGRGEEYCDRPPLLFLRCDDYRILLLARVQGTDMRLAAEMTARVNLLVGYVEASSSFTGQGPSPDFFTVESGDGRLSIHRSVPVFLPELARLVLPPEEPPGAAREGDAGRENGDSGRMTGRVLSWPELMGRVWQGRRARPGPLFHARLEKCG